MNRYAREISVRFTSPSNREYLRTALLEYFSQHYRGDLPRIRSFIDSNLNDNIFHAARAAEHDFRVSDPLPGVSVVDQVRCLNNSFISDRIDFIRTHVAVDAGTPELYSVGDGIPTTRHGRGWSKLTPNQLLATWKDNPGKPVQAREDPSGDSGVDAQLTSTVQYNLDGGRESFRGPWNSYYGMYSPEDRMTSPTFTGVTFCDQDHLGTSNHLIQYEDTQYKNALNREVSYANDPFGVATMMSDNRLLERRVFRSAFAVDGRENGVSRYEARLQRRHIDRDPSEGLRQESRDCIVLGHDMQSLYDRVDYHRETRQKNQSPYQPPKLSSNKQFW